MFLLDNIINSTIINNFTIMKKYLFLISVAAVAMTACTSETEEYVGSEQAREISFTAINQKATRGAGAILTAAFPDDNTMEVTAYQSAPTSGTSASGTNYFSKATFAKDGDVWTGGASPKYWPLSAATLNFFAVSGYGINASDITIANDLRTASVSYKTTGNPSSTAYSNTTQSDIMYAFNRGAVVQSGNNLTFNGGTDEAGSKVSMVFKHALAQVDFQVKAADDASKAITVNSIVLNSASYTGSLGIANDEKAQASEGAVSTTLTWTPDAAVATRTVPNITNYNLTTTYAPAAPSNACLLIIPQTTAFSSFTINYTFDNKSYSYTYTPASLAAAAGNKYTYQINFRLHEITVAPSVTPWTDNASGDITVF